MWTDSIDASMSMLRRLVRYVERDRIPNVHFARAKVEALPFPAGLFDRCSVSRYAKTDLNERDDRLRRLPSETDH
jgi:ubiquinone/menaquinone biosynthesis C-methylase UbiE